MQLYDDLDCIGRYILCSTRPYSDGYSYLDDNIIHNQNYEDILIDIDLDKCK